MFTIAQALAQPALQPAVMIAVQEMKLLLAVSRGVHEKLRYTIESNYHYTLFRD